MMTTMTAEKPAATATPEVMGENELSELMMSRAQMYGMLARLYRVEVDKPVLRELQGMRFPAATGNAKADEGYHLLFDYLKGAWEDSITELAIDYARSFLGNSVDAFGAAYPYESVYTSEKRLMMQAARDEVLAIYRSCGFTKREDWTEGEDHLALELEFMRALNDRAIEALQQGREEELLHLLATQRNFMEAHIVSWVPMMTADLKRFAQTKFYCGLAFITEGFLCTDYELLQDLLSEDDPE